MVGDTAVTVDELQSQISKQPPQMRTIYAVKEKKKEYLNNVVRFELMALEAQARGFDKDPEIQGMMKNQMISKFLARDYEAKMKAESVADAEVEKYYKAHEAEFNRPDVVRVSEILTKSESKAKEAAKEAAKAPKTDLNAFRALVNKYTEDQFGKQRGGDLAFFDKNATAHPKEVVAAAFTLANVGDVSAPVKSEKGWHVLKLTQKSQGFAKSLADAKPTIQQRLYYEQRGKMMDTLVAELREKYKVKMFEENLDKVVVDHGTIGAREPALSAPATGIRAAAEPASGTKTQ